MNNMLYDDVMRLASSVIVKRQDIAERFETLESAQAYERYSALKRGEQDFRIFSTLDFDIFLKEFEIPGNPGDTATIARAMMNSIDSLSEDRKKKIFEAHRKKYMDEYVETNDYYRELMGLPPMNAGNNVAVLTSDFGKKILTPYINKPLHELEGWVIDYLWNTGNMETIILENTKPSLPQAVKKNYVKYMGRRSIHFDKARTAKHLDILWYDLTNIPRAVEENFLREYYIQRNFHIRTIYDSEPFTHNENYAGFVGILILIATIRGLFITDSAELNLSEPYLNDILRSYDLYDEFSGLQIDRKISLIKNLDRLLQYAGSDKVLIEVAKLFGYKTSINRYHLVKFHNKDQNGKFIFPLRKDGVTPNYSKMYTLKFLKANVESERISLSDSKLLDFNPVVERDPLWQLEKDQLIKLKASNFNMELSKYVSIENAYDLSQLVFEIAYFLNFLVDNRAGVANITKVNTYSSSGMSDLFTYLLFFFACIAKRSKYDGNIIYAPNEIGRIMKFNLGVTGADIKAISDKYRLNINPEDFLYEKKAGFYTLNDLKEYYEKYIEIYERVKELLYKEDDYTRFKGLRLLHNTLFTHFSLESIFRKKDKTPATTYLDMLQDLDISLYNQVTLKEGEELNEMCSYVVRMLDELFESIQLDFLFLNTPDTQDSNLVNHFRAMIKLFLASSTTLDTFDVVYSIKDDSSMFRLFSQVNTHRFTSTSSRFSTYDKVTSHRVTCVKDTTYASDYVLNK